MIGTSHNLTSKTESICPVFSQLFLSSGQQCASVDARVVSMHQTPWNEIHEVWIQSYIRLVLQHYLSERGESHNLSFSLLAHYGDFYRKLLEQEATGVSPPPPHRYGGGSIVSTP